MTSNQPDQTPTEQPELVSTMVDTPPAESTLHALDDLNDAEYRLIMAFREKPEKEVIADDYEFPHTKNYADTLTMIYDPYSENFKMMYPIMMYQNEFKVSHAVAEAAVERIYAAETRPPEGDEIKLIRAYRHGNIEFARSVLANRSEEIGDDEDEPSPDVLNVGEQIAFAVVGQLAVEGSIERIYLQDSDYLVSFIMDIAAGINHALPQTDHVAVDRLFAARRRKTG